MHMQKNVMSIFDFLLEFISHFIIQGKILMQDKIRL